MWLALAVSTAGAAVTVAGILAVRSREHWVERYRTRFTSFAAGILLTVSFLHLIPEAAEESEAAVGPGLLAGFLLLYLVTRFAGAAAAATAGSNASLGVAALAGIGFHSFIDGVLFSIGFSTSAATGLLIAPGMILHEFVEGVLLYKLLLFAGFHRNRALWLAILAGAVTTPLGVALSWPLIIQLQPAMAASLIAAAAGSLIYVGGTHLLPQAEDKGKQIPIALLAGVGLGIMIVLLKHQ